MTIAPSLSLRLEQYNAEENAGAYGTFSASLPYNSRTGLKSMQLSAGVQQFRLDQKNQRQFIGSSVSSSISFAAPSFTPSITIPYTSRQFSFTGKVGVEAWGGDPNFFVSGYVSKQRIAAQDTLLALPSYGYLYFQEAAKNRSGAQD